MLVTTKKRLVILSISIIFLFLLFFIGYKVMNSREFMFFGSVITDVDTGEKAVYLTFDDGPTERTEEILSTLKELSVKATFFLIGENMQKYPEYTQMIIKEGHNIGNHSYSHQKLIFLPLATIIEEVERTDVIIRKAGYKKEIFFRPPFCKKLLLLPWYLSKTGRRTVTWTLEPESQKGINKSAEDMAAYACENLQNGTIILLHPMNDDTGRLLKTIKIIVKNAKEQGFVFKTLSDR